MSSYWNQNILYLNKKRLNKAEWNYLVNNYYNEYFATEAITQRRRQERNLRNNNLSIQQSNKNGLIKMHQKTGITTFFYYFNTYSYKYDVYLPKEDGSRKVEAYVLINSTGCWCFMGCFTLPKCQNLARYLQICGNNFPNCGNLGTTQPYP